MRILIFVEGTILMHKAGIGHPSKEIVRQVISKEKSVHDYDSYAPIGESAKKLISWSKDGANISYLTSRKKHEEIQQIKKVLKKTRVS